MGQKSRHATSMFLNCENAWQHHEDRPGGVAEVSEEEQNTV